MKRSLKEFQKLSELEEIIYIVCNLSQILVEYSGNKEFLIDILLEKITSLEEKFEEFALLFT